MCYIIKLNSYILQCIHIINYFLNLNNGCLCLEACREEYSKYIMSSPPERAAIEPGRLVPPAD